MGRLVVLPFLGVPMLTTGYPPRLFSLTTRLFSLTTQQQLIGCDLFPNTAHIFSFVFPDFGKKGYPVVSPIFFHICFNID